MRMVLSLAVVGAMVAGACGSTTDVADSSSPTVIFESDVERSDPDPDAPVRELAAGFNEAGFELLRMQEGNAVLSPLSIGHVVLMAEGAASPQTAEAIRSTFDLPDRAHQAWNTLDAEIVKSNGTATDLEQAPTPVVTVAAKIWPRAGFSPTEEWRDLLAAEHGATSESIDVSNSDVAADRINAWVSDETNGLIPQLIGPAFITPETRLVLTDAVYFKAQWARVFGKYGTRPVNFTNLDGSVSRVELNIDLEQEGERGRGDGYMAGEVGYAGEDYSMLVVVPDSGTFDDFVDRLSNDVLAEIDEAMVVGPWQLGLPEWETTTNFDFLDWLTEQDIAPGNFPGISDGVFLDGAVHGAVVSTDDVGTLAAAATALGFALSGPPEPELELIVDRPFLYLIRHLNTGAVLFVGKVTSLE